MHMKGLGQRKEKHTTWINDHVARKSITKYQFMFRDPRETNLKNNKSTYQDYSRN